MRPLPRRGEGRSGARRQRRRRAELLLRRLPRRLRAAPRRGARRALLLGAALERARPDAGDPPGRRPRSAGRPDGVRGAGRGRGHRVRAGAVDRRDPLRVLRLAQRAAAAADAGRRGGARQLRHAPGQGPLRSPVRGSPAPPRARPRGRLRAAAVARVRAGARARRRGEGPPRPRRDRLVPGVAAHDLLGGALRRLLPGDRPRHALAAGVDLDRARRAGPLLGRGPLLALRREGAPARPVQHGLAGRHRLRGGARHLGLAGAPGRRGLVRHRRDDPDARPDGALRRGARAAGGVGGGEPARDAGATRRAARRR